mmetsp:Transcript_22408/g.40461  ORF Transcript_22408/g.40461 Transcript_22408/m.40461 type:complete len:263 (+) Transcript_22408:13-801(+)
MSEIPLLFLEAMRQDLKANPREYSLSHYAVSETSEVKRFLWIGNSCLLGVVFSNPAVLKVIAPTTGSVTVEIPLNDDSEITTAAHVKNTDFVGIFFLHEYVERIVVVLRLYSLTSGTVVHEIDHFSGFDISLVDKDLRLYIPRMHQLDVFDLKTLSVVHTFNFPDYYAWPHLSPDGSQVYVAGSQDMYMFEVGAMTYSKMYQDHPGNPKGNASFIFEFGVVVWRHDLDSELQQVTVTRIADGKVIKEGWVMKKYTLIRSSPA